MIGISALPDVTKLFGGRPTIGILLAATVIMATGCSLETASPSHGPEVERPGGPAGAPLPTVVVRSAGSEPSIRTAPTETTDAGGRSAASTDRQAEDAPTSESAVEPTVPASVPEDAAGHDTGDGPVHQPVEEPTAPNTEAAPISPIVQAGGEPLVLADYFAWYSGVDWGSCYMSNGDAPLEPYNSDDAATYARHVAQALSVGIDGFTLQWTRPGGRTDSNFERLLAASEGTGFRSTIVTEQHFFHGIASQSQVVEALRHVMDRYSGHPNFLRVEAKPVLFFIDMQRVAVGPGQSPIAAWAAIRAQVDPQRQSLWIAEGDDSKLAYLDVFDGLYTYKVTHSGIPDAYVKLPRYGKAVRAKESQLGQRRYWIGTVMPGWDDLRSTCRSDVRIPSSPHRSDRADGAFYRANFDAVMASGADWLYVNSFNEWVEGHYVEPSAQHGHTYMELTREFAERFKQR